ncbi:MAG: glycosyltransferase [Candidatus Heimdallarchaeota archaeon]|nr:glycosyltransferase [Candidatus Heimdallarchaeota archaeon]
MDVSIVVPVYNEESNVTALYEEIKSVFKSLDLTYEVIFVDDGSTDDTVPTLRSLIDAGASNIKVIQLRQNFKKSAALTAGFQHVQGEVVFTIDGDLQDDPNEIPLFLEALTEEVDVVCGWRRKRKDKFFIKTLPSRIYNLFNRMLFGLKIHDSDCNFRAYRREAVKDLVLLKGGHRYVPAILDNLGFRLTEIEVHHRRRHAGKSKYGFRRLFQGTIDLITYKLLFSYGQRPLRLFFSLGIICLLAAFGFGVYLLVEKYAFGELIGDRPLLILVAVLGLSGFQIMFFGLLGELISQRNPEPSTVFKIRKIYGAKEEK